MGLGANLTRTPSAKVQPPPGYISTMGTKKGHKRLPPYRGRERMFPILAPRGANMGSTCRIAWWRFAVKPDRYLLAGRRRYPGGGPVQLLGISQGFQGLGQVIGQRGGELEVLACDRVLEPQEVGVEKTGAGPGGSSSHREGRPRGDGGCGRSAPGSGGCGRSSGRPPLGSSGRKYPDTL